MDRAPMDRTTMDRATMGSPDYERRAPLPLREIPPPDRLVARFPPLTPLRCYALGECSVIVTREFGRWHLSISHRARHPAWDEIAEARYRCLPDDVWMALHLPPKRHYVNLDSHCFQLVQTDPLPDGI